MPARKPLSRLVPPRAPGPGTEPASQRARAHMADAPEHSTPAGSQDTKHIVAPPLLLAMLSPPGVSAWRLSLSLGSRQSTVSSTSSLLHRHHQAPRLAPPPPPPPPSLSSSLSLLSRSSLSLVCTRRRRPSDGPRPPVVGADRCNPSPLASVSPHAPIIIRSIRQHV